MTTDVKARADRLDALVSIDPPLLVVARLAGASFDVVISNRRAILSLPLKGLASLQREQPQATQQINRRYPPPELAAALTSGVSVHMSSFQPTPDRVLAVDQFRLRWDEDTVANPLNKLGATNSIIEAIGAWLAIVRDWLSAWSGNPRVSIHLDDRPTMVIAFVDNPEAGPHGSGGRVPVFVNNMKAATSKEVRASFAAASVGRELPLERQLLHEASEHLMRRHHRHAVISACSAAEVALSASARDGLLRAGRSDKEIKEIMKGLSGIVELYRLNGIRRVGLPVSIGAVMAKLATPRNEAVHAGKMMTPTVASDALTAARAIVKMRSLATPNSLLKQSTAATSDTA